MSPILVAVSPILETLRPLAESLAQGLSLPVVAMEDPTPSLLLVVTPQRLELRHNGPGRENPIFVEWSQGSVGYRSRHTGLERLARAVGRGQGQRPSVLDATAGLGNDAFILAHLGYTVTLLERNPVVAALLQDGLQRAAHHPATQRMIFVPQDAIIYMEQTPSSSDVVYLDPMFPHHPRKAAQKKEMKLLRTLLGPEDDSPQLLAAALNFAQRRVVVKRPRDAPPIAGPSPSLTMAGNSTRFDIYLVHR